MQRMYRVLTTGAGGGGASANYYSPPGVITTIGQWAPQYNMSGEAIEDGSYAVGGGSNGAVLSPFIPPVAMTITQMAIIVTVSAGNLDIGLYDASFDRLVSTGSTAAGSAGIQVFDITNTSLSAGTLYYAGIAASDNSLRIAYSTQGTTGVAASTGQVYQSSAMPLPDPFVPALTGGNHLPLIGMSTLTTYG
jgi:hypothetical protein